MLVNMTMFQHPLHDYANKARAHQGVMNLHLQARQSWKVNDAVLDDDSGRPQATRVQTVITTREYGAIVLIITENGCLWQIFSKIQFTQYFYEADLYIVPEKGGGHFAANSKPKGPERSYVAQDQGNLAKVFLSSSFLFSGQINSACAVGQKTGDSMKDL